MTTSPWTASERSSAAGWRVRGTTLLLNGMLAARMLLSLGFYVLVARVFGTSGRLDLYWLAITPPLALTNVMEAAGVAVSINYVTSLARLSEARQRREVAGLVYVWLAIGLALAVGLLVLAPAIAARLGPGLPADRQAELTALLRLSSVAMCAGPAAMLGAVGILRAGGRYVAAAGVPLLAAGVQLGALLAGARSVLALTASFALAYVVGAGVAFSQLQSAWKPAWRWPGFAGRQLLWRQLPPLVLAELLLQLVLVRERSLASLLEPGAISALSLGLRLVAALGVLTSAGVEHTLAPALSRFHWEGAHGAARVSLGRASLAVAAFALVPGLALVVAPELWVSLAFRRGAFNAASVALTSAAVVSYLGVYLFTSVGRVFVTAAMSRQQAWPCVAVNGAALLVYVPLAPALMTRFGIAGLASGTSVAFLAATVLYAALARAPRRPAWDSAVGEAEASLRRGVTGEAEAYHSRARTRGGPLRRRRSYRTGLLDGDFLVARNLDRFLRAAIGEHVKAGMRVLDVGCGEQPLRHLVEERGARYVGIDVVPNAQATVHVIARITQVPARDAEFDVVLCTEVLEHVPDTRAAVAELKRLCVPGGVILITTPLMYPLHEEPFDFVRLTPHHLRRLAAEMGLVASRVETVGNELEVLAVVWNNMWSRGLSRRLGLVRLLLLAPLRLVANGLGAALGTALDRVVPRKACLSVVAVLRRPV